MTQRTVPVLLLSLIVGSASGATRAAYHPAFAFNDGVYAPSAMSAAKSRQSATILHNGANRIAVEQARIEVFQGDPTATRKQLVLYAAVISRFGLELFNSFNGSSQQYLLKDVSVEYVLLDFEGKPVQGETKTMRVDIALNQRDRWVRTPESGRALSKFICALPPLQRRYLEATAGYLYYNPGRPPVAFLRGGNIEAQKLADELDFLQVLVPEFSPEIAARLVQEGLEKLTIHGVRSLASSRLEWGADVASRKLKIMKILMYRRKGEAALGLSQRACITARPRAPHLSAQ